VRVLLGASIKLPPRSVNRVAAVAANSTRAFPSRPCRIRSVPFVSPQTPQPAPVVLRLMIGALPCMRAAIPSSVAPWATKSAA
jgi:hypothetical protein